MDCIPCMICDCDGARYSYSEDSDYLLQNHIFQPSSLEKILIPIFEFKLFSGFKNSINE